MKNHEFSFKYNILFSRYAAYVFSGLKTNLNWSLNGTLKYTDPCTGCSHCYQENQSNTSVEKRWWHVFIPRRGYSQSNQVDYSKIKNDKCGQFTEIPISSTELSLTTSNLNHLNHQEISSVKLQLGNNNIFFINLRYIYIKLSQSNNHYLYYF